MTRRNCGRFVRIAGEPSCRAAVSPEDAIPGLLRNGHDESATDWEDVVAEVRLLYSSKTWVAPEALPQLRRTSELSGMEYVAAMPDLHPGTGSPGGAVFVTRGVIHPKLIGGDIGCGMLLCATTLDANASARRLADRLSSIDGVWDGDVDAVMERHGLAENDYRAGLGTIGGGNHFAELQVVHSVVDEGRFAGAGLSKSKALLLIHSGSRGFGQAVLHAYNTEQRGQPLDPSSPDGQRYLEGHDRAVRYAGANREVIAERIMDRLGAEWSALLDLPHNFLERSAGVCGERWIHRKGAAPADRGLVVIPGSRSSYSYLVRPLGDGAINASSLAHGAGRKVSRNHCDEKFGRLSAEELRRTKDRKSGIDNLVICENKELLRQEHGKAYKDIDQVIEDLAGVGLIDVVAALKPILTYKTRAGSDDGEG